jgi:hypothetical protein
MITEISKKEHRNNNTRIIKVKNSRKEIRRKNLKKSVLKKRDRET